MEVWFFYREGTTAERPTRRSTGSSAGKCKACEPDRSRREFRADASFCRPISVYRHVVQVAIDNLYSSMHVQPEFYLPMFASLSDPHLEFSCRYFPSLVERREPCRCKIGLAEVVGISPCSICQPSLRLQDSLSERSLTSCLPAIVRRVPAMGDEIHSREYFSQ
jgi:hypothetical protein